MPISAVQRITNVWRRTATASYIASVRATLDVAKDASARSRRAVEYEKTRLRNARATARQKRIARATAPPPGAINVLCQALDDLRVLTDTAQYQTERLTRADAPWLVFITRQIDVRGVGLLVSRFRCCVSLTNRHTIHLHRLDRTDHEINHPNTPHDPTELCVNEYRRQIDKALDDGDLPKLVLILLDLIANGPPDSYMARSFGRAWYEAASNGYPP